MKSKLRKLTLADIEDAELALDIKTANEIKRQLRAALLDAYDRYKTSVVYEGLSETAKERQEILEWKQNLLDLNAEAFRNIPEKIKYYVR